MENSANPWDDLVNGQRPVPVAKARLVHFDGGEQGRPLALTLEQRAKLDKALERAERNLQRREQRKRERRTHEEI